MGRHDRQYAWLDNLFILVKCKTRRLINCTPIVLLIIHKFPHLQTAGTVELFYILGERTRLYFLNMAQYGSSQAPVL
jgi:hypothetical protein